MYGIVPPPDGIVAVVVTNSAIESIHTAEVFADSTLLALSEAKYEIVVFPGRDRHRSDAPGTTVTGFVCAPVEENEMFFTPECRRSPSARSRPILSPNRRTCTTPRRRLRRGRLGAVVSGGYV
jgi:hypothetical protein